jgi:hypothetical protein
MLFTALSNSEMSGLLVVVVGTAMSVLPQEAQQKAQNKSKIALFFMIYILKDYL